MPRKNKIYQLPQELRAKINDWLLDETSTLKDLVKIINEHELNNGIKISNGSLGRYKAQFDVAMKDLKSLEYLMKALPKELNFNKENDLHKFIYKILSKAVLDNSMGKDLKPREIMELSRAIKDLMASTKDREKIKQELEKEIKKTLTKKAKALGFSSEHIAKLLQQ